MTSRALLLIPVSLAILAALPAPASADGLPTVGVDASPLPVPGRDTEYTARRAGRATVLAERPSGGGKAVRTLRLRGVFAVPAVAYDGSPSGLSADGRTLVLINPRKRFPRADTTFAVIDAKHMRLRRHIRLAGDFSFDAISPDGRTVYLIQYLSKRDTTDYAVRAYDMRARRLLREPIVDPSEPDEDMSGVPLSRASDASGRWAYTLYEGKQYPFVHALDTERRTAVCIDLEGLRSLAGATLELRGDRLDVVAGPTLFASIDTKTNEVIPRGKPKRATAGTQDAGAGTPWLLIAGPTAALMLLAAVGRRRSTTRTAAP